MLLVSIIQGIYIQMFGHGICRCYFPKLLKNKFAWRLHAYRNFCLKDKFAHNIDSEWQSVVGLEIHAQISAKSKLFSCSRTNFGAPTNTEVSYFDAAIPGSLPVLNKYCVEAGILTALALNCTVNKISAFDRKHYFYPDLPAGYQVTQHFHPLASNGYLKFHVCDQSQGISYECCSHLKQLQLEQDSGRSFHMQGESLVDLNRAGIGLMEIVFEPDLRNGLEAAALVKELILILKRLGSCSCEMEEGALRVDANISVNPIGKPLGVKTEVKNINSLRYIARAIDFEISRQKKLLQDGNYVTNETRAFDYSTKETFFMRDKETLQDYRFLPEPNLPPIRICEESNTEFHENESSTVNIDKLRQQVPVLPLTERKELMKKYDLTYEIADKLVCTECLKEIFEVIASIIHDRLFICGFLLSNVQHQLNIRKSSFSNCPLSGIQIAEIIQLVVSKTISEGTANDILEMKFNGDQRSAKDIVAEYNWYQITDDDELEKLCRNAMAARPKMVKKYRNSRKQRYMTPLLVALNESANNRASIKDAERIFIKLICGEKKLKTSGTSSDHSDNSDLKCNNDS